MSTFTITESNEIVAFATPEEAAATTATPFDSFSSAQELAKLAASWPTERLLAIWNTLPGVSPVKKFTSRATAVKRIWTAIQGLGDGTGEPKPEDAPAENPKADRKAKGGHRVANVAPAEAKATRKTTPAKPAPKAKKAAKAREAAGPREGSKMAQVIALMQRKGGVTISEVMEKMGWQKHTVRGFMAGAMKKAGYSVESFKPEGGERTYRIGK